MKFRALILGLSLVANAALLVVWQRAHVVPTTETAAPLPAASGLKLPPAVKPSTSKPPPAVLPVSPAPAKADWSHIWSPDLKEYVARLRAAGCPEETVQDIIVAEVGRRFAPRQRALFPERFDASFWKVEKSDRKEQLERSRKTRELDEEQTALLVELLGVDPRKARSKELGIYEWLEDRVGFLPENKRDAARKVLDQFDERMREVSDRNQGIYDAQYRAERHELEQERLAGLAQILMPEEVRQWELRQSQTASQLQNDLRGLELSEAEYGRLFDVRKKYGDSTYNYTDLEPEAKKAVQIAKEAMKADVRAALGDSRAQEFERLQDYNYQQLDRLAKRNDLPAGTAGKIYDVKAAAEAAAKQIRANTSLTSDQQRQALLEIRTATELTVKTEIGEKAFKSYQRSGAWWINSLSSVPSRSPGP